MTADGNGGGESTDGGDVDDEARAVRAGVASPVARAREGVLSEHADAVEATLTCADAVAADLPSPVTDGRALATAIERELASRDLLSRYVEVLSTALDAADLTPAAAPVAAPPYVTVTSRGPVLRGSTDGGRLVVVLAAFAVERDPVRYVRTAGSPEEALSVAVRR